MVVEDEKSQKTLLQNINSHPLDPLSLDEITKSISIVKSKENLGKELLFETIMLKSVNIILNSLIKSKLHFVQLLSLIFQ